jgi:exopolysaccharide production protein ExoZ
MIYNLHLLRALAALAVVYFHTTSEAGLALPINIGAHGVDVFFVVSGFIIAFTGVRSSQGFLRRRLIRIVPFYWTTTLVVFALALLFPHLMHTTQADFTQLVCSLLFIPRDTSYAGIMPVLILGWSLNYEIYFYLLFALALLIDKRRAPIVCMALIATLAAAVVWSGTTEPSLRFYARPLVFEFCYGIACFYLLELAERHIDLLREWPSFRGVLLLLAVVALCALGLEEYHAGWGLPRFIVAGLPATLLVLSIVLLERVCGLRAQSKAVVALGEASYILYLIHPYVVYTILRVVFPHARAFAPLAIAALVVGLLMVSAMIAIAIHYRFERPVMQYLRGRLLPTARAALSAQISPVS